MRGTERGKVYENTLKIEIRKIVDRNEKIDLWIISHLRKFVFLIKSE